MRCLLLSRWLAGVGKKGANDARLRSVAPGRPKRFDTLLIDQHVHGTCNAAARDVSWELATTVALTMLNSVRVICLLC
jgi:hypothetical protein